MDRKLYALVAILLVPGSLANSQSAGPPPALFPNVASTTFEGTKSWWKPNPGESQMIAISPPFQKTKELELYLDSTEEHAATMDCHHNDVYQPGGQFPLGTGSGVGPVSVDNLQLVSPRILVSSYPGAPAAEDAQWGFLFEGSPGAFQVGDLTDMLLCHFVAYSLSVYASWTISVPDPYNPGQTVGQDEQGYLSGGFEVIQPYSALEYICFYNDDTP